MKLYYSPGACSLATNIALREAGRRFELERVDLKSHRTASGADYYTINPKGYVPALQLDGPGSELLTESPAILQYVADLAPETGLAAPYGTLARYRLEEMLSFVSSELHKQFGPLFLPETPPPTAARARGKIAERFRYLSDVLVDRGYLLGETFTVADAYLFVMLRWCDRFDIDLLIWPNLDGYFDRVLERPTVQRALVVEGLVEPKRYRQTG